MLCEAVQYMRPNGRRVPQTVELDESVRPNYERMQEAGFHLSAEVLLTGHVSVTIENDETDLDLRVVPNDADEMKDAYETMLQRKFPVYE